MVSKNQIKLITGLQQKKFRQSQELFFAEGIKVIGELLQSDFELEHLYETASLFPQVMAATTPTISESELKTISVLSTPNNCLALFKIPKQKPIVDAGLIVVLDDIRDPGNLGTIMRLCDWFGVEQLVCSPKTVDIYNPKVIQATMGSISRVAIHYTELKPFLANSKLSIFGTFMDGNNIYAEKLPASGIIIMGNEANGISEAVENLAKNRIAIPRFGKLKQTESLNVATATAIILSEFRRNA